MRPYCKVSGVGVTDHDGEELIANLSASDLRRIQPEHFGMLGLPVAELLALLHGGAIHGAPPLRMTVPAYFLKPIKVCPEVA